MGMGEEMSDPNSRMKERCDHPGPDGKFRVKADCGYCKRDVEIVRLRAALNGAIEGLHPDVCENLGDVADVVSELRAAAGDTPTQGEK